MTVLHRYLLRQNLVLLVSCLGVGMGVYILADLFDRLDDFLEAGLGIRIIVTYFCVKLPLIVSQILPAALLLSLLLQMGVMQKNRELLALQAGGVPFLRLARFVCFYCLMLCFVQLAFSQLVGVYGEREAGRIWKEDVRKTQMDRRVLYNVWFKEGNNVVKLDQTTPARQTGEGITVYVLTEGRMEWEKIIRAASFIGSKKGWTLHGVEVLDPAGFVIEQMESLELPLTQNLTAFVAIDPQRDPTQLPIWQLGHVIQELGASGSNVEGLRTVWHMKISYAFSLAVMGLIALTLVSMFDNLYLNIIIGLVLTFAYYGLTMVFVSMGQKGFLPPFLAAWAGNFFFSGVCILHLAWHTRQRG